MTGREVVRRAAGVLPAEPGVYRFRDDRGRAIYLGRATELRARVRSYAGDLADRPHLRRMAPQVARVEALVCASVPEAAWLERNLLQRSLPRWNRVRGGMELVGRLEVDADPAQPRLRLLVGDADSPAQAFGPYLGIERLVLARSALLRAWPLELTGERLAATDRSLAEARAVRPGDRDHFAERIRAALGREQDAVAELRERLAQTQGRAVAQLAFETAGRVVEEAAAVDWLVAPQRVTGCAAGLIVAAWADGVLVTLKASGDRLDSWTSRPASREAAEQVASATPDAWRDFAVRNAELAAALREVDGSAAS